MSRECTFKSRFHPGQCVRATVDGLARTAVVDAITFDRRGRVTYVVQLDAEPTPRTLDSCELAELGQDRGEAHQRLLDKQEARDAQRSGR